MTTVPARDFNRDVSAAKRAAADGPVIITDRGEPSHVLLTIEDYRRLTAADRSIIDWLSMDEDVEFEPGTVHVGLNVPQL
jgi:prevent-host-death family protein